MHSFAEKQRTNFFLVKLRSKLKNKILSTNNVLKQREEILAMIIMQKNILNRVRPDNGDFGEKYSGNSNKDKPLKTRISKSNTTSKDNDKSTRSQEEEKKDKDKKRKSETNSNDIKTPDIY